MAPSLPVIARVPHTVKQPPRCPHCGSTRLIRKGTRRKKLEIAPFGKGVLRILGESAYTLIKNGPLESRCMISPALTHMASSHIAPVVARSSPAEASQVSGEFQPCKNRRQNVATISQLLPLSAPEPNANKVPGFPRIETGTSRFVPLILAECVFGT